MPDQSHGSGVPVNNLLSKSLGEEICAVVFGLAVEQLDRAIQNLLPRKVIPDLNMLGPSMEHWVLSYRHATLVVAI